MPPSRSHHRPRCLDVRSYPESRHSSARAADAAGIDRSRSRQQLARFMGRKSLIVLCATVLLGGGGCVSTSSSSIDAPTQASAPNYRAIIAKSLKAKPDFHSPSVPSGSTYFTDRGGIFLDDKNIENVEVSDAIRMVQTNFFGWAWETCIRLNVTNSPATYAVFISDGRVVDARAANPTDNCEGNYAPLEIKDESNGQVSRPTRKTPKSGH